MEDFIVDLGKRRDVKLFIVSGGFPEIIGPVASRLGISKGNISSNRFIKDQDGNVLGVKNSPMFGDGGKVKIIERWKSAGVLKGKNIMVGDGYADLETYLYGAVDEHICFYGAVDNEDVRRRSLRTAANVEELSAIVYKMASL
jgi:phosphoserine phosphatase